MYSNYYLTFITFALIKRYNKSIAAKNTNTYIILKINGNPPSKKYKILKFNIPILPQFKAPIITRKKDTLSKILSLNINIPPYFNLFNIYYEYKNLNITIYI